MHNPPSRGRGPIHALDGTDWVSPPAGTFHPAIRTRNYLPWTPAARRHCRGDSRSRDGDPPLRCPGSCAGARWLCAGHPRSRDRHCRRALRRGSRRNTGRRLTHRRRAGSPVQSDQLWRQSWHCLLIATEPAGLRFLRGESCGDHRSGLRFGCCAPREWRPRAYPVVWHWQARLLHRAGTWPLSARRPGVRRRCFPRSRAPGLPRAWPAVCTGRRLRRRASTRT
jgi:hypothetical protein